MEHFGLVGFEPCQKILYQINQIGYEMANLPPAGAQQHLEAGGIAMKTVDLDIDEEPPTIQRVIPTVKACYREFSGLDYAIRTNQSREVVCEARKLLGYTCLFGEASDKAQRQRFGIAEPCFEIRKTLQICGLATQRVYSRSVSDPTSL